MSPVQALLQVRQEGPSDSSVPVVVTLSAQSAGTKPTGELASKELASEGLADEELAASRRCEGVGEHLLDTGFVRHLSYDLRRESVLEVRNAEGADQCGGGQWEYTVHLEDGRGEARIRQWKSETRQGAAGCLPGGAIPAESAVGAEAGAVWRLCGVQVDRGGIEERLERARSCWKENRELVRSQELSGEAVESSSCEWVSLSKILCGVRKLLTFSLI